MSDHDDVKWSEENTRAFLDYGRYFVPEREQQIETMCTLVPEREGPFNIVELCCGEGLLAGALLLCFPNATVYGFDGSSEMLQHARLNLVRYGERFRALPFELADTAWRQPGWPVHAVLSSLAIHHLDGAQKQALFRDVYAMLEPGGVFIVTDVMAPTHQLGESVAAQSWDEAVRRRAQRFDGHLGAYEAFKREQWNFYRYPDDSGIDKPSSLFDQLKWLEAAGFQAVDVFWMLAGHAIFGGVKG